MSPRRDRYRRLTQTIPCSGDVCRTCQYLLEEFFTSEKNNPGEAAIALDRAADPHLQENNHDDSADPPPPPPSRVRRTRH